MDTNRRILFPPLRKNFFKTGNASISPTKKDYFKIQEHKTKTKFHLLQKDSKLRDLSVSPRYLKYHQDLIHKSRVSLIDDFSSMRIPYKTPITLVKLSDFELERWRD